MRRIMYLINTNSRFLAKLHRRFVRVKHNRILFSYTDFFCKSFHYWYLVMALAAETFYMSENINYTTNKCVAIDGSHITCLTCMYLAEQNAVLLQDIYTIRKNVLHVILAFNTKIKVFSDMASRLLEIADV